MKKLLNILVLLAITLATPALASCSDDITGQKATTLNEALRQLYPDLNPKYVKWEKEGKYSVGDFQAQGIDYDVWFDKQNTWQMTERDYGTNYQTIAATIQAELAEAQANAGNGMRIDDISIYEHRNGSRIILIEFENHADRERKYAFKNGRLIPTSTYNYQKKDITPNCGIW